MSLYDPLCGRGVMVAREVVALQEWVQFSTGHPILGDKMTVRYVIAGLVILSYLVFMVWYRRREVREEASRRMKMRMLHEELFSSLEDARRSRNSYVFHVATFLVASGALLLAVVVAAILP